MKVGKIMEAAFLVRAGVRILGCGERGQEPASQAFAGLIA
jgi:hypothetical protein